MPASAMRKVIQNLQSVLHDGVGFRSLQMGDEPDAAPVLLELGIVESLSFRKAGDVHLMSYRCPLDVHVDRYSTRQKR
jgi:hypothetical protein